MSTRDEQLALLVEINNAKDAAERITGNLSTPFWIGYIISYDFLPLFTKLQAKLGPLVFGDDWKPQQKGESMNTYNRYRRTQIAEMADWTPDFDMGGVSVSDEDRKAGSPKTGDKIARNPANHKDRWLVAAAYFAANFEPVGDDWKGEQK